MSSRRLSYAASARPRLKLKLFFSTEQSHDDWLVACLLLIRQDRRGVIAHLKKQRSVWRKNDFAKNPTKRIRNSVAVRLWASLKGRSDGRLFSRLGYSAQELVDHLSHLFKDGMSWDNYGRWHVDHIKPCSLFDLSDPIQFSECWSLDNLQPLWRDDNIRKGARYGAP